MGIFAERLKEAMQQANITSAQLAKQTGIGRSSISQWLSSKYVAKHDKVTALATVLNVSPDWLLGTTDIATAATPEAVPIPVAVTPTPAVDPELMTLWEQLDTKQRAKLDLVPASSNLASLDIQLVKRQLIDAQYNLSEALKQVRDDYDYIILDTPPAISMVVLNALTASDYVIVPTQADIYGLKGLGKLAGTINSIQKHSNPSVQVLGILVGRYDARTNFTKAITDMLQDTSKKLHTRVFNTKIREAIAIKEAQGERTNLFEYAPKAKVTKDVNQFLNELLGGLL